ncbi:MAG TPA: beta-ketoacyl synthase N-terminal-like domain-containing protein, partial [Gammaproteobacteria bacterium]|nr:beta-ketoacyl synthase N-terminal-like domain-containing protein [Gammaproteobacteria bacterium]
MDAINDNDLYLRLKKAINSLEHERHHVQQLQAKMNEPLAIIGMSCYLPGGINNVELFWQALIQQQNIIQPLSDQRWSTHELVNKTPQTAGKMISDKGGFILDHHQFDANFFGISPREAIMMDPQQRLILLDKDFQQIAAVLGVLFSGNFFVPIHLDNPPARISEIIQQANIKCLITTKENALKNNIHNMAIIDPHYVSATEKFSIKRISQQALAYVIYTSGTTGIPKGVAISQRALIGFRIELNEIENVLRKKLLLDEIFVDVQDIHQTKQMIAYCVVSNKDKEKIIDKLSINKNSFAKSVNKININESFHHEKDWFTRKSYRHWMKGQASIDFIKNIFKMEETINSTKNSLPTALTLLQGIQDPALPLPKYRYPSAGGLYPVKCYISIGNSALELPRGYYYFSQLDSTLVQINQNPMSDQNTIFLIADTTYIQSYYPTKWRMFCEVEAGHIFALLNKYLHLSVSTDSLAKKSLSLTDSDEIIAQYQITNAALSDKPIVSFSLFLPQQYSKLSHYHYYDGKTETWIEHETTCEIYSLDQNTKIIKNALGVMVFDHSASFIEVGQFIELLSQSLLQYQIGMC